MTPKDDLFNDLLDHMKEQNISWQVSVVNTEISYIIQVSFISVQVLVPSFLCTIWLAVEMYFKV